MKLGSRYLYNDPYNNNKNTLKIKTGEITSEAAYLAWVNLGLPNSLDALPSLFLRPPGL